MLLTRHLSRSQLRADPSFWLGMPLVCHDIKPLSVAIRNNHYFVFSISIQINFVSLSNFHVRLLYAFAFQDTTSAYVAGLKYSYSVQGVAYSGGHHRRFMLHKSAMQWIGGYNEGLPLTVRYNPANPKDSKLFEKEHLISESPD